MEPEVIVTLRWGCLFPSEKPGVWAVMEKLVSDEYGCSAFNLNLQEVEQKIKSSRLAPATYQENRQHNERKENQFSYHSDLVANFLSLNP